MRSPNVFLEPPPRLCSPRVLEAPLGPLSTCTSQAPSQVLAPGGPEGQQGALWPRSGRLQGPSLGSLAVRQA